MQPNGTEIPDGSPYALTNKTAQAYIMDDDTLYVMPKATGENIRITNQQFAIQRKDKEVIVSAKEFLTMTLDHTPKESP